MLALDDVEEEEVQLLQKAAAAHSNSNVSGAHIGGRLGLINPSRPTMKQTMNGIPLHGMFF